MQDVTLLPRRFIPLHNQVLQNTNNYTSIYVANFGRHFMRDGAILGPGGQWPPLDFQKKNLVYIYSILFLAICFNKITLAPLNNIIDIFKCYKKNISPPIKIKPKQHTQKKKIRAGFNEISM